MARKREEVYWTVNFGPQQGDESLSESDWQDLVLQTLRKAVERRLVADVPVGVLLSGGLDSSIIVALLAEAGQHGLQTFSIGFETVGNEVGDEFQYSDIIAKRFETDHHKLFVDSSRTLPELENCVRAMAEPMVSHDCDRLLSAVAGGRQARQGRAERPGRRRDLRRLSLVSADAGEPRPGLRLCPRLLRPRSGGDGAGARPAHARRGLQPRSSSSGTSPNPAPTGRSTRRCGWTPTSCWWTTRSSASTT